MNQSVLHPHYNSVMSLLELQLQKIIDFEQHLTEIKTAITDNKIENLERLIAQTSDHYQLLESHQTKLYSLLVEAGFNDQSSALDQYILEYDDPSKQLSDLKNTVFGHLKELEKALMVNDLLVRKNQHRIKQSIRILSGHNPTGDTATYTSEGNTDSDSSSQKTLARA